MAWGSMHRAGICFFPMSQDPVSTGVLLCRKSAHLPRSPDPFGARPGNGTAHRFPAVLCCWDARSSSMRNL